ncbi:MAG: HK97-gp10 family putative phage morphogenesis protein [Aurantimonas endophytica]|uniref:HK97-gp10 family putative phage morphogenesis protein n=1 Tax=Aurantimonas endophytica TaxID=1522175 RepID=UPI00300223CD
MKIERLEAFKKKLAALPAETRSEVRKALEKGAEEIVDLMKRSVPIDEGDLRDSIGWTFGDDVPEGAVVVAKSGREAVSAAGLAVTIYAGSRAAYYARFVEFGTQKMGARPFFFPSFRLGRKRVVNRVNRATRAAAKRVAAG